MVIYDEYKELITRDHKTPRNQNVDRTNFDRFVEAILSEGIDMVNFLLDFPDLFNLENASGIALDMIGTLVGASRKLKYTIGDVSVLDDEYYRILIMSMISAESWDGTNESLVNVLRNVFEGFNVSFIDGGVYTVSAPMTMQYTIEGDFEDDDIALIANSLGLISPAGVGVTCEAAGNVIDLTAYSAAKQVGAEIIDEAATT